MDFWDCGPATLVFAGELDFDRHGLVLGAEQHRMRARLMSKSAYIGSLACILGFSLFFLPR